MAWAQLIALLSLVEAAPLQGVRLAPTSIQMGALYQETPVRVEGSAQPGSYTVTAYECRQGRVVRQSQATLAVRRVGLPATVAALAHQRPAQYAGLAVIAAMIAGFGIDFVISRLRGKKRKWGEALGGAEAAPEHQPASSTRRGGH